MGIGNIGWTEFLVILAIALIFFGPRRLPGIAQTIGKSLREFQKALNEVKSEIAQAGREADARNAITRIPPRPAEKAANQQSDVAGSPYPPETTREAEVVVEEDEDEVPEADSEVTVTPKRPIVTGDEAKAEPPDASEARAEAEPEAGAEPEARTDEADVSHANPGNPNRS